MNNPPKASEKLHHFYTGLEEILKTWKKRVAPKIKEVHDHGGNYLKLRDIGASGSSTSQNFARLSRQPPLIGDRVLTLQLETGEYVVLGKLYEGESEFASIDPDATVKELYIRSGAGDTSVFRIYAEDATQIADMRQDVGNRFFRLYNGDGLRIYVDTSNLRLSLDTDVSGEGRVAVAGYGTFMRLRMGDSAFSSSMSYAPNMGNPGASRYFGPESFIPVVGSGTITLTQNRAYAVPVVFPDDGTVDEFGFEVTTAVASSLVRMSLYDSTLAGFPNNRLTSPGGVSTATLGVKSITPTGFTVKGGLVYHIVIACTHAGVAIRNFTAGKSYYGAATAGEINRYSCVYETLAGGWGSFSNPWAGATGNRIANDMPAIHVSLA